MLDAGADVGLDLTGGYYDAGDNVKFNFPQAAAMTLLAWSGIAFQDAYKKSGQWKYLLEAVKWGTDYFITCHSDKNTLYVQVGDGQKDHSWWYPPEAINYEYPSMKIDAEHPGSEVASETAASMAAASILFKEEDSSYSATLIKHAKEIYEFADKYRDDYVKAVPNAQGFYNTYSGFIDDLAWGAAWMFYATGDEEYKKKYEAIADAEYSHYDPKRYIECEGPISWDDKRPGAYVLMAILTKEEKRMNEAITYCDTILTQPKTPGGLWYDQQLSKWASNRYAANAASMLAIMAAYMDESDEKRKKYIEFTQKQIDYILGANPAGIDYVVGADKSSPKSVHHRGSSCTGTPESQPKENIYTLYGALAGGPGPSDDYKDSRTNYEMNEVALDYNAAFTLDLAALLHFGLGVKDGKVDFDRAWPPKAPTPDVSLDISSSGVSVSTGSGLTCCGWCVSFKFDGKIDGISGGTLIKSEGGEVVVCNGGGNGYLDGKGTKRSIGFKADGEVPKEVDFQCDGFFKPPIDWQDYYYRAEDGHHYKVTAPGGTGNTKPLFENGNCWPNFVC